MKIIKAAKERTLSSDCYVEKHHIIPKSLGGPNDSDNLVKLKAREHFICHVLLPKFLFGEAKSKMIMAIFIMVGKKQKLKNTSNFKFKISSRLYETTKKQYSLDLIKRNIENNPQKLQHNREKLSIRSSGEKNPMYGKTHSETNRKKQSVRQKKIEKWKGEKNPKAKSIKYRGISYPTIKAAAIANGIKFSTMRARLRYQKKFNDCRFGIEEILLEGNNNEKF